MEWRNDSWAKWPVAIAIKRISSASPCAGVLQRYRLRRHFCQNVHDTSECFVETLIASVTRKRSKNLKSNSNHYRPPSLSWRHLIQTQFSTRIDCLQPRSQGHPRVLGPTNDPWYKPVPGFQIVERMKNKTTIKSEPGEKFIVALFWFLSIIWEPGYPGTGWSIARSDWHNLFSKTLFVIAVYRCVVVCSNQEPGKKLESDWNPGQKALSWNTTEENVTSATSIYLRW